MPRAASVSAAKTPTAEAVSEGAMVPQGRKHRAWRLLVFAKQSARKRERRRRARQSGSAQRGGADTHGLVSGGSGPKKVPAGHVFEPRPPRDKAFLPAQAEGSMPEA